MMEPLLIPPRIPSEFMNNKIVDLRSDTLTLPSPEMRQAMFEAPLGDDVIDIDPTVEALQQRIAAMLGKEAAIFMPSGTMTNQAALRLHCQPGDEFICEEGCHIFNYEQGAYAQLSGLACRTVATSDSIMRLNQIRNLVRPESEHVVRTKLLCLENTHNKGGGRVLPLDNVRELCDWAKSVGLKTHLDGARLFNAVVATGIPAIEWGHGFDTISICFSKGLGAPVGSALVGSRDDIKRCRRIRKIFGGGMRQAGVIAAGALYALENNIERLSEDHAVAKILGDGIREIEGLELDPSQVETNIVIFKVAARLGDAPTFVKQLAEVGIRAMPFSHEHVRFVTHMHVSRSDADYAVEMLKQKVSRLS